MCRLKYDFDFWGWKDSKALCGRWIPDSFTTNTNGLNTFSRRAFGSVSLFLNHNFIVQWSVEFEMGKSNPVRNLNHFFHFPWILINFSSWSSSGLYNPIQYLWNIYHGFYGIYINLKNYWIYLQRAYFQDIGTQFHCHESPGNWGWNENDEDEWDLPWFSGDP